MSTMRDVAGLAGVSGKTVSRVINGDKYVSAAVQERVQRAILELKYVPNMLSQTFRNGRDSAIGIAVPDIADPFFGAVIQAVADQARTRSTAVLVTSLGSDPDDEQPSVEALLRRHIAGLILAPTSTDQEYIKGWQQHTEVIFIDRPPRRVTADSVVEDDFGAAVTAVAHLLERGHRRIAFIGNRSAVVTTGRRLDGYRAALIAAGIAPDPVLEALHEESGCDAVGSLRSILALPDPPTAIFSSNSQSSIAMVPQLHEQRRTDVAFISFGDFPMAGALKPAVTVLDQNPGLLGSTAAQRLFRRIDQPGLKLRRQIVLPVELRIRESSGVPVDPSRFNGTTRTRVAVNG